MKMCVAVKVELYTFLPTALEGVKLQLQDTAALLPVMEAKLGKRLGGPQGWSGRRDDGKISAPAMNRTPTSFMCCA
jgi:hypothetical protein